MTMTYSPDPAANPDPAYAGGAYPPSGGVAATPPSTVQWAFGLMMLRALFSLVSLVLTFVFKNQLRDQIIRNNTSNDPNVDAILNNAVTIGVVVAAIFLVLYVGLAFAVRAGRQWARVVTFIIAGLGVLSLISAFSTNMVGTARVISIVSAVIDLIIIIALAMRPTSEYIAARRGRV